MSDVKTGAVLDDTELGDGQMKIVDFEGGQVLLSRVNGTVHATSAHCTHVRAPLSTADIVRRAAGQGQPRDGRALDLPVARRVLQCVHGRH